MFKALKVLKRNKTEVEEAKQQVAETFTKTQKQYENAAKLAANVAPWVEKVVFGELTEMKIKLAKGDVVYSDSYWLDLVFYVKNKHPILGICFAHPEHPFTKLGRLLFLLSSAAFGYSLVLIWAMILPREIFASRTIGNQDVYIAQVFGLGAVQSLYDTVFTTMSAVNCIHRKSIPKFIRYSVKACGSVTICEIISLTFLFLLGSLLGYFLSAISDPLDFTLLTIDFLYSKVTSYFGFTLVFELVMYSISRVKEQRKIQKANGDNEKITASNNDNLANAV